ncbi:hypothetical protein CHLNCDRAFT_137056 [Chlorella variabilis]|uniref:Auxin efflux carrier component n=1 Tax=Chlorella variabilis TaxID=554065 RepID=E1ZLW2_CHLVA|nr:hypothetical protein CHLNCDRAFT_137056 [Chlorella variabilis]EFN53206.1 hypothetical protein CHLNCDRAFT_137056 [Chlorella variabilis]|eukprot:XP_005845308.1 hypothetical protein CHLNCDRAFT_137056 [Chlorella variabilis]
MWEFQDVLNQDLAILLVMAAGALSVWRTLVFRQDDMRIFNVFLFKFTLPASVILGLGLKTDLYKADIWRFVGAFLMMRGIMLAACALVFGGLLRRSLGEVTANWLSTTWISTVILGTPLLRALLGPQYANLGVVAGISSFIFQLPLMLILFEVHTWRQQTIHGALPEQQQAPPQPQGQDSAAERRRGGDDGSQRAGDGSKRLAAAKQQPTVLSVVDASSVPPPRGAAAAGRSSLGDMMRQRLLGCMGWHMTRKQGQRLGLRLVMNHVLWGVGLGLVLSLSTLGPRYLNPGTLPAQPNCTYAVGAGFIFLLLEYFARCTEPVAFFATGKQPVRMWMVRPRPIATGWLRAAAYMAVKLVLVPALMVGCCFAVGLEGANARAAVLVATLPVSAAAFALSKTYSVGEDVAVTNVFLGNLLVLPTTIAWLEFMDGIGLFMVAPKATAPAPTCVAWDA